MKKSIVYTKTGDKGTTSLVRGMRVSKTHIRLDAYGTVDELNSYVGWLNCAVKEEEHRDFLRYIQHKLFTVGSYLATETESKDPKPASINSERDIVRIEEQIDIIDENLPRLDRFVLPGGNEAAARAHICRTVTRRAERNVYRVAEKFPVAEEVLIFLNRLSDYFFVFARYESNKTTSEEIFWEQGIYKNFLLHLRKNCINNKLNILSMYWTLELASKLEDAPWPATKDELIDYAQRSGAPLEVIENLQEIEEDGEIFESIEDIWPDYPSKEDFFFNEDEY
jgi:cob(I)alamin adenosyltransferase